MLALSSPPPSHDYYESIDVSSSSASPGHVGGEREYENIIECKDQDGPSTVQERHQRHDDDDSENGEDEDCSGLDTTSHFKNVFNSTKKLDGKSVFSSSRVRDTPLIYIFQVEYAKKRRRIKFVFLSINIYKFNQIFSNHRQKH